MTLDQADRAAAAAMWLATHLRWRVVPLHPGGKRPMAGCPDCRGGGGHSPGTCPCLARGDGALCHAVWAATNDPAVVARWARRWRTPVWGVHLGASGLLCVDLDAHGGTPPAQPLNGRPWPNGDRPPVDGIDTFAVLADLAGAAFDVDTFATETPSGGMHLVYTADSQRWKSINSRVRDGEDRVSFGLGWQIDVKSHGGYVLLPGSTTTAGTYRRASATTTPAPLPTWLAAELARTGHDRTHTPAPTPTAPPPVVALGDSGTERYAAAALRTACTELAAMQPRTGRNDKLFRATCSLAGMVAAEWIDRDTVETALADAAHQAGLPASEIRYALASGFARPRPAPDIRTPA